MRVVMGCGMSCGGGCGSRGICSIVRTSNRSISGLAGGFDELDALDLAVGPIQMSAGTS